MLSQGKKSFYPVNIATKALEWRTKLCCHCCDDKGHIPCVWVMLWLPYRVQVTASIGITVASIITAEHMAFTGGLKNQPVTLVIM